MIITSAALDFQRIALPPMELVPPEIIGKIKEIIADVLNFPTILLNNDSSQTYDNYKQAKNQLYTDVLIPYAEMISQSFTNFFFGENWRGYKIEFDFSKIPSLQQNFIENQNKLSLESENLVYINSNIKNGTITREQAIFMLEKNGYTNEVAQKLV